MTTSDADLLREYTQKNSEEAFAELVKRHLNLVYCAALRQVRSPQLAEEVAQSAFTDLARNAQRLAPGTILTAWLYQVTRRTAIDVVRRESRRQLREKIATEMNAMNASAADWAHIEPLLDEAMQALEETDRAAVLLRYFENKSLREVGEAFGTSDDAAQKRVSRAVERLREYFSKRNVTIGASGLIVAISANAVQAAPAGLATTISTAASITGTVVAASATATAVKAIAMTTLQKVFITAGIAATLGTGIYKASRASSLRTQVQTLQQQQAPLAGQVQQLTQERDDISAKLAAVQQENERLLQTTAEVPKLRGEVVRLQSLKQHSVQTTATDASDPFSESVQALAAKAVELKQHLEQMPDKNIPELQLLNVNDWLEAAKDASFQSDADVRKALAKLRNLAKHKFGGMAGNALDKYMQANNGQLPADPSLLLPFFDQPVDGAIFQRYQMLQTGNVADLPPNTLVMGEKAPVDTDYDSHQYIGPHGRSSTWATGINQSGDPDKSWAARQ